MGGSYAGPTQPVHEVQDASTNMPSSMSASAKRSVVSNLAHTTQRTVQELELIMKTLSQGDLTMDEERKMMMLLSQLKLNLVLLLVTAREMRSLEAP